MNDNNKLSKCCNAPIYRKVVCEKCGHYCNSTKKCKICNRYEFECNCFKNINKKMVLVQVKVDQETDKKIKQFMLDNDIEVKAKAIMCLAKMKLNEGGRDKRTNYKSK